MPRESKNYLTEQGFKLAETITRYHGKSFFFASGPLPLNKKKATYAVYAFCRKSDDAVDKEKDSLKKIDSIEENLNKVYSASPPTDPLSLCFKRTVDEFKIPKEYFSELLSGMRMDLSKKRYQTFSQLYEYCYKVAGVIGLIMLKIYGTSDEKSNACAVKLGIAMQLTNILRDIKEDYQMGRIYLPLDELKIFNVTENDFADENCNENFVKMMKFNIARAREYYQGSEQGVSLISDKRSRFVAKAMGAIYAAILEAIEKLNYNVFAQRAYVSKPLKLMILGRLTLNFKINLP
jgi:15-cis-phytoene synthase